VPYRFLADAVLVLHLGVVLFVVGGWACILVGNRARSWPWVNSMRYRLAHLAAIGIVAAQAWLGQECPLTTLESWLRVQSGTSGYEKGFIEYWVQWLIFFQAPSWVFTAIYTCFAVLVMATWLAYPPVRQGRHKGDA
jgi:hypothetical protein